MIRRLRTFILITGTLLCVLIAVAFVVSGWCLLIVQVPTEYGPCVWVGYGTSGVEFHERYIVRLWIGQEDPPHEPLPDWGSWNYWKAGNWKAGNWRAGGRYLYVPLYALFLAVAAPTLLVWRFVPKFPRGHCRRCGYNLTGLTEARCPECGTGFVSNRV